MKPTTNAILEAHGCRVSVGIEIITPEMAKRYLEQNVKNRKVRDAVVTRLGRELRNGEWRFTHQGIAFGKGGGLIDGQHRLRAIVNTGVAAVSLVFRDLEESVQEACDMTIGRSVAENLMLQDGVANGNVMMSLLNNLVGGVLGTKDKLSLQQVRRVLAALPEAVKVAVRV